MSHYALLDKVKLALRIQDSDETLSEELEKYLTDSDTWINRKLRNHLGFTDIHQNPIIIPFTEDTNIPIDDDLIQNATDLAVGKFRKEQNNEENLWENAKENFQSYLDDRFGWVEDSPHRVANPTTLSYTPVDIVLAGQVITVEGTNFHQFQVITIEFAGQVVDSTPVTVFADAQGKFSNVKFVIPDNLTESKAYELKARDGDENQDNRASTYISVNVDDGTLFDFSIDALTLGQSFHNVFVDAVLKKFNVNNDSLVDAIIT